jgi:hypothetical protein
MKRTTKFISFMLQHLIDRRPEIAVILFSAKRSLEEEEELVSGRQRRQDDPSGCPAGKVEASWLNRRRGEGQPCHLYLTA